MDQMQIWSGTSPSLARSELNAIALRRKKNLKGADGPAETKAFKDYGANFGAHLCDAVTKHQQEREQSQKDKTCWL